MVGQETKLPPGDSLTSSEAALRARGWRGKIGQCVSGPGGGHSAGTIAVTRRHIGLSEAAAGAVCHAGRLQLQKVGGGLQRRDAPRLPLLAGHDRAIGPKEP